MSSSLSSIRCSGLVIPWSTRASLVLLAIANVFSKKSIASWSIRAIVKDILCYTSLKLISRLLFYCRYNIIDLKPYTIPE